MWESVVNLFSGGAVKSIENIASEWIETDLEKAEAKTLMLKTLDPNGRMRRNQSDRVLALYTVYMLLMMLLLVGESFNVGPMNGEVLAVSLATTKLTALFVPITGMVTMIISASFGVNYQNSKNGV